MPTTRPALLALLCAALASACAGGGTAPEEPRYVPPRPAPPVVDAPDRAPAEGGAAAAGPGAGAQGAAAESSAPAAEAEESPSVLAYVDGRPVAVDELLSTWLRREPRELQDSLQLLIDGHLAGAEARRLGLQIGPGRLDAEVARARARLEQQIVDTGLAFDDYVRQRLGVDPTNYVRILRGDTLRELVLERVIRAWVLSSEHARVRAIVVRGPERVEAVEAALAGGRAFEDVARELSIDESAERGGLMPPVVRNESSLLSSLAFAGEVGEVRGPIEEANGTSLWVRVEERPEPLTGTWQQLAPSVEASLQERPVDDFEFIQWKVDAVGRYDVDVRPFLELVGEPERLR